MSIGANGRVGNIKLAPKRTVQLRVERLLDLLIVSVIWEGEDTEYTDRCTQYVNCQVPTVCRRSDSSSGRTEEGFEPGELREPLAAMGLLSLALRTEGMLTGGRG